MTRQAVDELLSVASAEEREAARRYRLLAQQAAAQGRDDIATTAEALGQEAEIRAEAILVRAALPSKGPPPAGYGRANLPRGVAERWDDLMVSGDLTAYRLLAHAVSEVALAFARHTYRASAAGEDDVRMAAEQLAYEELGRAARLRQQRRQAFRGENRAGRVDAEPGTGQGEVVQSWLEDLGQRLAGLAQVCRDQGNPTAADLLASILPQFQHGERITLRSEAPPGDLLRQALVALQTASESLESLVARTQDEQVQKMALSGLESVVGGITTIMHCLDEQARLMDVGHERGIV